MTEFEEIDADGIKWRYRVEDGETKNPLNRKMRIRGKAERHYFRRIEVMTTGAGVGTSENGP